MGKINHIKENGYDIIHSDLRNTKDLEMIDLINEETEQILLRGEKFRIIVDVSDSFTTPKFMKTAYDFAQRTKWLMVIGAIIGISGAKKVLLKGYNRVAAPHIFTPFDTIEEAVEHVTKN